MHERKRREIICAEVGRAIAEAWLKVKQKPGKQGVRQAMLADFALVPAGEYRYLGRRCSIFRSEATI